jgi:secreted trypsin-like serine protease
MLRTRLPCILALTLASFACSDPHVEAAEDQALIGGHDEAGLPAVGAILYDGSWGCTGTLIAPRTVLTAAHCLLTEAGAPYAPARLAFALGPDAHAPQARLEVVAAEAHPDYDGTTAQHDLGVLHLAARAPAQPIPPLRAMDASWDGTTFLFVGYGTLGGGRGGGGTKRATSMAIRAIAPDTFRYGNAQRNTCWGDSGGPALFENAAGAMFVAGTTSWGDDRCAEFAVDTRVDRHIDWILAHL